MDAQNTITIGVLLLALVTVESGGLFLKRVVQGNAPANDLQKSFYRAGHAHAAVLLILSIAILSVIDVADLTGILGVIARDGVPVAAILMPAGFQRSAETESAGRAPLDRCGLPDAWAHHLRHRAARRRSRNGWLTELPLP